VSGTGPLFSQGRVTAAEGNWQLARELLGRLLPKPSRIAFYPLTTAIAVEYRTGCFERGGEYVHRLVREARASTRETLVEGIHAVEYSGWASYVSGHFGEAEQEGKRIALDLLASPPKPVAELQTHIGLGYFALAERDLQAARAHYDKLKDRPPWLFGTAGVFADLLGALARFLGRPDEAVAHLETAQSHFSGLRPTWAWVSCELGETLLERGASGDRARARELLADVLEGARELGMPPIEERASRALAALRKRRDASYPAGLTEREVELLGHVARGRTNKEIAAELGISVKTVHTHLGNIFEKIGVGNRTEAAAFATSHSLA
jgi:DNA-binding CsgD family transcriptional regulator